MRPTRLQAYICEVQNRQVIQRGFEGCLDGRRVIRHAVTAGVVGRALDVDESGVARKQFSSAPSTIAHPRLAKKSPRLVFIVMLITAYHENQRSMFHEIVRVSGIPGQKAAAAARISITGLVFIRSSRGSQHLTGPVGQRVEYRRSNNIVRPQHDETQQQAHWN